MPDEVVKKFMVKAAASMRVFKMKRMEQREQQIKLWQEEVRQLEENLRERQEELQQKEEDLRQQQEELRQRQEDLRQRQEKLKQLEEEQAKDVVPDMASWLHSLTADLCKMIE